MQKSTTILLLLISLSLSAQVEELSPIFKQNVIGGSASFSKNTNSNQILDIELGAIPHLTATTVAERKHSAYSFSPYYARALNPKLMIGVTVQYSFTKDENIGIRTSIFLNVPQEEVNVQEDRSSIIENSGLNYWLFARYSFSPDRKLNFFVEPMLGVRTSKRTFFSNRNSFAFPSEEGTQESRLERTLFDVRVVPAVSYAIGKRWNLLARMGAISYSKGDEVNTEQYTELNGPTTDLRSDIDVSEFNASFRFSSFYFGLEFKF